MTKECFTEGVNTITAVFPNITAPKESQKVWYRFLKKITNDEYNGAIERICTKIENYYSTTNFVALVFKNLKESNEPTGYEDIENV